MYTIFDIVVFFFVMEWEEERKNGNGIERCSGILFLAYCFSELRNFKITHSRGSVASLESCTSSFSSVAVATSTATPISARKNEL